MQCRSITMLLLAFVSQYSTDTDIQVVDSYIYERKKMRNVRCSFVNAQICVLAAYLPPAVYLLPLFRVLRSLKHFFNSVSLASSSTGTLQWVKKYIRIIYEFTTGRVGEASFAISGLAVHTLCFRILGYPRWSYCC